MVYPSTSMAYLVTLVLGCSVDHQQHAGGWKVKRLIIIGEYVYVFIYLFFYPFAFTEES